MTLHCWVTIYLYGSEDKHVRILLLLLCSIYRYSIENQNRFIITKGISANTAIENPNIIKISNHLNLTVYCMTGTMN